MPLTRILALDVGSRRIGVAITDPLGLTAQPLLTVHRSTLKADLKSIARLVRRHEVTAIVVGHPVYLSGEASAQTRKTEAFVEALRGHLPETPVHLLDERLTTAHAHELMDQSSGKRRTAADRKHRSEVVDQAAAVLILEAWMTMDQPHLLPDPEPDLTA